jgi:AcrR family transcriptional regulator
VRDRLLDAALAVLRDGGVRQLTQPRVAERAGVRQSHLTYYFPTRHDLLEAAADRFVTGVADGIDRAARDAARGGEAAALGPVLATLAGAVVDRAHMRMFIGVSVEADGDPAVHALLLRGTQRIVDALADAVGGADAADAERRARTVLATLWGLGFYEFLVRPDASDAPTRAVLARLETLLAHELPRAPTGGLSPAVGA